MTEDEIQTNYIALKAAGWNPDMAEALAENDHTVETAKWLSPKEALDYYLTWNGICGYTHSIINAIDNCRNMEGL